MSLGAALTCTRVQHVWDCAVWGGRTILGSMVELLTAVAAVIGALAGLVNSWQIARLTGRVDSIEQTQHHVFGALMHGLPKRD